MAFSALEALQAFGAGRQMALQDRQLARNEATLLRQERARTQAGQMVRAGDLVGAAATAFEGGDDDLLQSVGRLSQAQQQQAISEATAGLSVARTLRALPMEQRAAAAQRYLPTLRQSGFSDQEISDLSADLSDGALDGHIQFTQTIAAMGQRGQAQQQRPYRFRNNSGDLVELGPDGQPRVVYDDPNERVNWVQVDNGDGTRQLIPMGPNGPVGQQQAAPDDDEWEYEGGPQQSAAGGF